MERMLPHFRARAREVLEGRAELQSDEDWRELLCGDCPFYHHGEEENEECGSYLILKALLEREGLDLKRALDVLDER
jgi:hypothetical protein